MKYLKLYESSNRFTLFDYMKSKYNDINKNSKIIRNVLHCREKGITSLEGLEMFTNLEFLYCENNNLRDLNYIETCTKLKTLTCQYNHIESLKGIEYLINLEWLDCSNNMLTNLDDVENLTKLKFLNTSNNPWEFPLPTNLVNKFKIDYAQSRIEHFKNYYTQKHFLKKYPERVNDLKQVGFHEQIKEEFDDIIEGGDFSFFGLK